MIALLRNVFVAVFELSALGISIAVPGYVPCHVDDQTQFKNDKLLSSDNMLRKRFLQATLNPKTLIPKF